MDIIDTIRELAWSPVGLGTLGFLIVLFIALVTIRILRGRKKTGGRESSTEDLAEYPPPPKAGDTRLLFENIPVRVRLVVIAPVGKNVIDLDDVEGLLDQVVEGLGDVVSADKPKIKVWKPQLSSQGFAPSFHRLTEKPEPDGKPSRWILVAGPASAGKRPLLVGLALLAEKPTKKGRLTLEPSNWPALLSITTH